MRLRSTYEYAGVPDFHLAPQGVSTIVDTSTTEVIEAYTAVLSDLFLNNNKLARFVPYNDTAPAYKVAHDASMSSISLSFQRIDQSPIYVMADREAVMTPLA